MFCYQQGYELSLVDMCYDLFLASDTKITKQSIQDRFNAKAVAFLQSVLSTLLAQKLNSEVNYDSLSRACL